MRYELAVILKPLLPDDVRKAVHKGIVSIVSELGGKVEDVDVWGKRYLAYKIKEHTEGYYLIYMLDMPSAGIDEVGRRLKLNQEVLRTLTVKIEKDEEIGKVLKKKKLEI